MWLFRTCIFYQTHNIFHFERMYIILFFPRTFKLKYQFAICAFLQNNCVPWMVSTTFGKHTKIGWTFINLYCELKANAMRPDAKYHDEPCRMPFETMRNCTICTTTTRWMCWGCNMELGGVFPVCSPSTGRNCFAEMHKLRTDIWVWMS